MSPESRVSLPTLSDVELNTSRIERVKSRLKFMRDIEENPKREGFSIYTTDRDGFEYMLEMQGLRGSLEYAAGLGNGVVLDIGAGTGRGVSDLYDYGIYAQIPLWFEATVLDKSKAVDARLSPDRIHETSVEYLEGIPPESVSLAIALCSIMYSADPELAIKRIDEVLVPGGVLKATFSSNPKYVMSGSKPFIDALKNYGYDIDIRYPSFDGETYERDDLVLAVKPGLGAKTASELMKSDERFLTSSLNELMALRLKFGNI